MSISKAKLRFNKHLRLIILLLKCPRYENPGVPHLKSDCDIRLARRGRRLLYIHAHLARGERGREGESGPPAGPVATLGG